MPDDPATPENGPLAEDAAAAEEEAAKADAAKQIETKLELVGAVALLSVTAVVRALQARSTGELPEEQRQALTKVRDDLRTALERVDAQLATGQPAGLDLSGLREKLARTLHALEQWPLGTQNLPS